MNTTMFKIGKEQNNRVMNHLNELMAGDSFIFFARGLKEEIFRIKKELKSEYYIYMKAELKRCFFIKIEMYDSIICKVNRLMLQEILNDFWSNSCLEDRCCFFLENDNIDELIDYLKCIIQKNKPIDDLVLNYCNGYIENVPDDEHDNLNVVVK